MFRILSICCVVFLVSISSLFAQDSISLNSYKYIIVPNQYEFQKSADQYEINSLTKFLFEKYGFNTMFSGESFPEDLAKNPCLALKANLIDQGSMLSTKINLELVDCRNAVVYTSEEGRSKIKDFKKGYHDAIRKAFDSIPTFDYKYDGSNNNLNQAVSNKAVVVEKSVSPVVQEAKEVVEKTEVPVVVATETKVEEPAVEVSPKTEVVTTTKVAETAVVVPVVVAETTSPKPVKEVADSVPSIEGSYLIDMWGKCEVAKKGDGYSVIGGDENYEFATIKKTSKPTIFMVKKTGFSQTQMLELTAEGNLQIDTENGIKVFKRLK